MKTVISCSAILLTVFLTFATHLFLVAPGLYWGESALVTARAWQMGGSHPSGYGAYLQLLHFSQKILPFGDIPFRSNCCGVFYLALATGLLAFLFLQFKVPLVIAIPGSMMFSIAVPVLHATAAAEVYSFHILLILIVLNLVLKSPETIKWVFLGSFLSGIAVTHHLTYVFFLPGLTYVFLKTILKKKQKLKLVSISLVFFLLGLSLYVYLPIRETCIPVLVWGESSKLSGFITLITASEETTGSLISGISDLDSIQKRAIIIGNILNKSLSILGLILACLGIVALWKKSLDYIAISLTVLVLLTFSVIVYNSNETASFYLPGILLIWVFSVMGFYSMILWMRNFRSKITVTLSHGLLFLPLCLLILLLPSVSSQCAAGIRMPHILSSYRLNTSPNDSVFISRRSDYCFLNWYQEQIEKRSSSNTVFQHLLSFKWYYRDLVQEDLLNNNLLGYSFEDSWSWNSAVTATIVFQNLNKRRIIIAENEILSDLEKAGFTDYSLSCLPFGVELDSLDVFRSVPVIPFYIQGNVDSITAHLLSLEFLRQSKFYELCGDYSSSKSAKKVASELHEFKTTNAKILW
ncbi:DUF2723 domain-containing protein [bacterium]|nr:DUF2723 domain-containing protein [bacterium]